jgi:hypothetical protein
MLSSMWELASSRKGWQTLRAQQTEKLTSVPFVGAVIEQILSVRKARAPDGLIEAQCVTELNAIVQVGS